MLKLSYSFFGFGRRHVITLVSWDRIKISDRLWWLLIWLILENRNIAILHCSSQSHLNVAGGLTLDEVPGFSDLYVYSNIEIAIVLLQWVSFAVMPSRLKNKIQMMEEASSHVEVNKPCLKSDPRFVATQWTTYSSFREKWGSLPPSGRPTLPFIRNEVRCHSVDDLLSFSGEVRFVATQWTTYSSFLEKWGSLSPSGWPTLPFGRSEVRCHPVDDLLFLSGEVRLVATRWTT